MPIIRYCHTCQKTTKWNDSNYLVKRDWETYKCSCGNIVEYKVR